MASKGQRFQKYDLEFKMKVLKEYKAGNSAGYLSQKYQIPISTIKTWDRLYNRDGALEKNKRGRPSGSQLKDYKERYEILKKFQDFLVKKGQEKK